ncbi:MAG: SPFH domain-containing protein [Victivallaceae bacterium]|nr:SPFH domain-containing protein [Victivallaceae bacterium]
MKNLLPGIVLAVVIAIGLFVWYGCRIEPGNGQIAVLIRKTGTPLPPGEIIAVKPGQQGIQLDVLGEGRYFRNPYLWDWQIVPALEVPAGKFAVLVRKFGRDSGTIIAANDASRGILPGVLGTGRHRINPHAYEVRLFDDIRIMPGNVGVVTSLTGADVFSGVPNDFTVQDGFLVQRGRKGVIAEVLKEGTHRVNPFLQSITIVNTQSQRHEFSGRDAITFLTLDGFTVSLEGTVEFNIDAALASRLTQVVGNMDDILKKIILPSVHGFARIEGSKKSATEFIIGESRRLFQEDLDKYLRGNCRKWGIVINSVLIRDIIVPQEIAGIIRNRELAQQEAHKYSQEISRARSEAELARQKMLAEQNLRKVAAETEQLTTRIAANQAQMEKIAAAESLLRVAAIDYETAKAESRARLNTAEAERQVIEEGLRKDAEVLSTRIAAFGSPENYIRSKLYEKLMPNLTSIVVNGKDAGSFGLPGIGKVEDNEVRK